MVIDDEQTQELAKAQIFQWASLKVVIVRDGTLLMGTRLDSDEQGLYEFPGGKAEVGETIEEAIVRETREETGLAIKPGFKLIALDQNQKRNIIINFVKVEAEAGELNPEVEELGEMRFYTKEELAELLKAGRMRQSSIPVVEKFLAGEV